MYIFQIIAIIGSVALFAFVIDFIRRGLLKEKYSVLWIISALAIMALSVKKGLLDAIAGFLGIAYPPSLLFLVAFVFILLINLHFSVVISILHEKNKALVQDITLLKNSLREAGIDLSGKAKEREPRDNG
ncbi:MAG: DUF2304 domain-containing protein [Deltaproteobacteria bacterium]|nr:DUF2304 domain-containing protein [Deltaproteobacteria bacterium]